MPSPKPKPPSGGGSDDGPPPHVHTWDGGVLTLEATCEADGERTYHCTENASHTKTEAVPATGHAYGGWTPDGGTGHQKICPNPGCPAPVVTEPHSFTETVVDSTCTEAGYTEHTCSVCVYRYQDAETPATGHAYTWAVNSDGATHTGSCPNPNCPEPTLTEAHDWGIWEERAGVTGHVRTCKVCGGEETALHAWEYTDNKDGATHTKTCAVGGESVSLPHNWTDTAPCPECGAVKPAAASVTIIAAVWAFTGSEPELSLGWTLDLANCTISELSLTATSSGLTINSTAANGDTDVKSVINDCSSGYGAAQEVQLVITKDGAELYRGTWSFTLPASYLPSTSPDGGGLLTEVP